MEGLAASVMVAPKHPARDMGEHQECVRLSISVNKFTKGLLGDLSKPTLTTSLAYPPWRGETEVGMGMPLTVWVTHWMAQLLVHGGYLEIHVALTMDHPAHLTLGAPVLCVFSEAAWVSVGWIGQTDPPHGPLPETCDGSWDL